MEWGKGGRGGGGGEATENSYQGCDCAGPCVAGTCRCMQISELGATGESRALNVSVYECGPACHCSHASCNTSCHNRVFQSSSPTTAACPGFEIFRTPHKGGWGVRATRQFGVGELVVEYVGELIEYEEVNARRCEQLRKVRVKET
jgi:hypothetical protein